MAALRGLAPLAAALALLAVASSARGDPAVAPAPDEAAAASVAPRDATIEPRDESAPVPERHLPQASALPPAQPDPAVAPIIEGRDAVPEPPAPVQPRDRPEVVIKTILGLLALVALAYLAAHPAVQRLERFLGISQVITAGFPFVLLGMLARRPSVGILSDEMLAELSPALRIGLGFIGLVVGFRFDGRTFGELPPGAARAVALGASLPFALVLGASGAALLVLTGDVAAAPVLDNPVFVRDALILGTAGAMAALPPVAADARAAGPFARIARLEELAGVIGLAVVAAMFRPLAGATWQLPGTAWLLLTVGLGATVGLVAYAILQRPHDDAEFVVLTLGSVSFAAGLAGYLRLSPVVVAFIAGVLLANFPGAYKPRLDATLRRLERPIYLLSLTVIGALWDVSDWRGWLLMPVFAAARLGGKWLAVQSATRGGALLLAPGERAALAVAPMGPLAIAIVVNAQLLYPGGSISLIVSAVVGGAILTEIAVQLWGRRRTPGTPAPGAVER